MSEPTSTPPGIAVVGMAGRFPGAPDPETFWENLRAGTESISFFTRRELEAEGIAPRLLDQPGWVSARGIVEDHDLFDAELFGFNPREAELTDPQHRIFLECAWLALEDAGLVPETWDGLVGIYAAATKNTWLDHHLRGHPELADVLTTVAYFGNDTDFLVTRAAYKLGLTGPALSVRTACSSSLVAVSLACQALWDYQCDAALAGGVSLLFPHKSGYVHRPGGTTSSDGHCRAFDAASDGGVLGSGVGLVVLKRLEDALAEGDRVQAVITGAAVNNDGSEKAGFTAPSVRGQARAIAMAQAVAEVEPADIDYVETHGTGTRLGDQVEIAALSRVFGDARGFAAAAGASRRVVLGSVKTNIGHLDTAAGIAGLIKTVLALRHGEIPATVHFEAPNPRLELDSTPFEISGRLLEWPRRADGGPRRAGVSSFGIGGTNVHLIVEEAPPAAPSTPRRGPVLLLVSARTANTLEAVTGRLAARLESAPEQDLADVAATLAAGRRRLPHRRALVAGDRGAALGALAARDPTVLLEYVDEARDRPVGFLLSGVGDHYTDMGLGLYRQQEVFRREVDRCAEILAGELEGDLREVLYPGGTGREEASAAAPQGGGRDAMRALLGRGERTVLSPELRRTLWAQPAVFTIDWALARQWMAWGVRPRALLGYSLGEYVAAALAGVFALEDALRLVARRARLIEEIEPGAMLAVSLSGDEAARRLSGALGVAAVNGPELSVVAGPGEEVDELEGHLAEAGITARRLGIGHPFHTPLLEPVVGRFRELVAGCERHAPEIPLLSNVTGTWMTPENAADPDYWCRHLVEPVRFADGLAELWRDPTRLLVETGPGQGLATLARQAMPADAEGQVLRSLRTAHESGSDTAFLLGEVGRLWLFGGAVDAHRLHGEGRRRVDLPGYPFEHRRYRVEPAAPAAEAGTAIARRADLADWFYLPAWHRAPRPPASYPAAAGDRDTLRIVFAERGGLGDELAAGLEARGERVVRVVAGAAFERRGAATFVLDPGRAEDYESLLAEVADTGEALAVVHLWSLDASRHDDPAERFREQQAVGCSSLLRLARALSRRGGPAPVELTVVTGGIWDVTGAETLAPERSTVLGPALVIPQELPHVTCRSVDLDRPDAAALTAELGGGEPAVAWRGGERWVRHFVPWRLEAPADEEVPLRRDGVYLITGGFGNIGRTLTTHLVGELGARVALVGRTGLPEPEAWDAWLEGHDRDDRTSGWIHLLREIDPTGEKVLPLAADVAAAAAARAAVAATRRRFGALHGVFHAAGVLEADAFRSVSEIDDVLCARHFAPKVHGLLTLEGALEAELEDGELEVVHLFSSSSCVLGGLGFAAYTAANLYLDAWVRQARRRRPEVRWSSAAWDTWSPPRGRRAALPGGLGSTVAGLSMSPPEGIDALRRVLSLRGAGEVVVSVGDLERRLDQWIRPSRAAAEDGAASVSPAPGERHARPSLATPYVTPRNEVERTLARIWADLLGLEEVGVHDNFFQLGGHSLLAVQVVSRVRDTFGLELPMEAFFTDPTVSALDRIIENIEIEQAGGDEVAALLAEIEQPDSALSGETR